MISTAAHADHATLRCAAYLRFACVETAVGLCPALRTVDHTYSIICCYLPAFCTGTKLYCIKMRSRSLIGNRPGGGATSQSQVRRSAFAPPRQAGRNLLDKKLSYRRVTARCVLSVVILPITTQQCRNYLYDKS